MNDSPNHQTYRHQFDTFDKNGDGLIDISEFKEILQDLQKSKSKICSLTGAPMLSIISDQEIQTLFENHNIKNPKNGMSYKEFLAMIDIVREADDEIKKQFEFFDTNNDGKISKKELKRGLKKLDVGKLSEKMVNEMMNAADLDGDGEVDFEEFRSILLK